MNTNIKGKEEFVSNKILTLPNVITFLRLLLIPLFFYFMFNNQHISGLITYIICSLTDFVDGQIARRTSSISKLGQLLDPACDTLLMSSGIIVAYLFFNLNIIVMVLIFFREIFMLFAGAFLIKKFNIRIPVIYPGKIATALLFFGICLVFINELGLYIIYAGFLLQIFVTIYYIIQAYKQLNATRK